MTNRRCLQQLNAIFANGAQLNALLEVTLYYTYTFYAVQIEMFNERENDVHCTTEKIKCINTTAIKLFSNALKNTLCNKAESRKEQHNWRDQA